MYLSKLEIVGFKSFANRMLMRFDAGITAIVGPNGCGKTNVVDAIRWVLGEQKPSTLRSDKMEDVIFNGTKNRKPIGMADVSLVIENTRGILPSEYSEVTITRRVYRSGESEYYLNKTRCRLKDIRDLFMDTGMGADAYSVIELKMVETILSDRTDERRRLFEEAAGVTKYKFQRKEALRKLDTVQQDLLRVNDMVKEVQKTVNSLERQAQKAEKYNEIAQQLRLMEIDLLEREYSGLMGKITSLKENLDGAVSEKDRIDQILSSEENQLEEHRDQMDELERRLTAAQSDLSDQQQKINSAQQRHIAASERRRALFAAIERYEKEKVDLGQQLAELRIRETELHQLIEITHQRVKEATQTYIQKKDALDAFGLQLDQKKAEGKKLQDAIVGLLNALSGKRQEQERTKARIENIHGRIDYSAEENSIYEHEIETNSELVQQLTAQDKDLRRQFAEAEVRVHQIEAYKISLEKEIGTLRNREFEVRSALDRRHARLDFLKSLVESYDGYSEGARFLITNEAWKANVDTTVADALSTPAEYRIAVEAALGETSGFIVVRNVEEAYRGIEFLKQHEKGKATFICLDRIPSAEERLRYRTSEGVIGWVRDVIRCDPSHQNLFDFLLENTLLVQTVEAASQQVAQEPSLRCVTLDGELVTGEGVLKGGSVRQDEGGMIGKKAQIAELEEETTELEHTRTDVRKQLTAKETALTTVDVKSLAEEAKKIEQQMTSVEMRIAQIEFEKKRSAENIQRNAAESAKLAAEANLLQIDLNKLMPEIEALEQQKSNTEQQSGAVSSEIETMEVLWSEYSTVANEAHLTLLKFENEETNHARELEYTKATIANISSSLMQRDTDIADAANEIERLSAELSENERTLSSLNGEFKAMLERKKTVDAEYNSIRDRVHSIQLKIKDERRLHENSVAATHSLEMKLNELRMKAESLVTRARDEFTLVLQLKKYPQEELFNTEEAHAEVQRLKDRIRSLGPINFAAFDEFRTEKERLEFITVQRDDLIESEKTLIRTIEEINTTAQKTFFGTFGKIREYFISTFKELFDEGDECDLVLEEGVDPLEARIEINAKPRGKRPTSIDLLSGGEKTLTAIALLFAIYLVKPSPFCILDEVDAPLDDSNIDRFTRILRKFSDNTQFIVVTHNKRTMESANALYGVTMEEEGVSKLVSVRFNESKVMQN